MKEPITKKEIRTGLKYGIIGLLIGIWALNFGYIFISILISASGFFFIAFCIGALVESIRSKRKKLK